MKNFVPYFELGTINDNPAAKIVDTGGTGHLMTPIMLATMVVALFEAAMYPVEEKYQIQYEQIFRDCLNHIMDKRHECETNIYKGTSNEEL